jgi:kynurenine formamidase
VSGRLERHAGFTAEDAEESMLVDVSHVVEHGMITYKGIPAPLICDFLSREESRSHYAAGTEFHIGRVDMVANTGTYVDSPFHRYANGKDLSELPLKRLANLEGVVIHADLSEGRAICRAAFQAHELRGKAVLVQTGWDAHWRTDQYFEGHPFLTRDAAEYLVEAGAALVGIDSLNIDDTADLTRPVHSILLASEIPIVEHLRDLGQLSDADFRFFAVPVKVKSMGTFPVRAFGLVNETS